MDKFVSSKKDIISLFLGIIAIHMYVISLTTESLVLIFVSIIDSSIAFFLGIGTDSDYGHGGLIIGLLIIIVSLITLFVS
ncbi:hypothetical protein FHS15_001543 [Paenibacillus castaneae]|uniref:hypothetical protein n=1 Tax=Paenibacillus castaneae TaxID=474957 RepID=UPI000C9BEB94|nr:hypothetical protein [Paenibacillus castaneae]NIK76418.1 hypothetical protein [Paenibacillus castaneae]